MRGAALPCALLAASLGLALSYSPPKPALQPVAILVVTSLAIAVVPLAGLSDDIAFTGCWLGILACAACVHLPKGPGPWLLRILALNAGIWAGLVSHVEGGAMAVVTGLPLVLLALAGQWIVRRGWGIAIKVACSWLIAIALLELGLMLVPTPGYAPDHME